MKCVICLADITWPQYVSIAEVLPEDVTSYKAGGLTIMFPVGPARLKPAHIICFRQTSSTKRWALARLPAKPRRNYSGRPISAADYRKWKRGT